MKRLARRLFMLLSAVSLLLCVAVCVLWVLSYRTAYTLDWYSEYREAPATSGHVYSQVLWRVAAGRGSIVVARADRTFDLHESGWAWERSPVESLHTDAFPTDSLANRLGFATDVYRSPQTSADAVLLPLWLFSLLAVLTPAVWLRLFVRHRRRSRPGRCNFCGYDLRATPGRCPECGTAAAATTPHAT